MKKIITLLLLSCSLATSAAKLNCSLENRGSFQWERAVEIEDGAKMEIGSFNNHIFYVYKNGDQFELDAYDVSVPSRSYALANLVESEDTLSWSFWSRKVLLAFKCILL